MNLESFLGGIIYINSLGQEMIILNSPKAVEELLGKKSANYSDKPVYGVWRDLWMESALGSHPVRPTVPRVKEAHEPVNWDASECGKIRAITRKGNGKVFCEGRGQPWLPDPTGLQVICRLFFRSYSGPA